MSYLLTEIALEMLGYKFYDIYGMQDEINNFQKHSSNDRSADNPNEINLAQMLGISSDADKCRKTSQNKEIYEEVSVGLHESLTKLMDNEYHKVRQQILHTKPNVDSQNAQNFLRNFVESQQDNLRLEHQNLRSFRKIVEQHLLQINPTTFEKYCQTFKPARKQLKRLDTNKK